MPLVLANVSGSVNTSEYDRYLNDARDPVRLDITKRAQKVLVEAERRCPVRTGLLRSTGRKNDGLDGEKPYTDVIFGRDGETDYLGYVLNGTPAHEITPHQNRPNAHLRFVVGGAVIYARVVHHPGTRANNFMEKSIPAAASSA
jgi:hypothetical protein